MVKKINMVKKILLENQELNSINLKKIQNLMRQISQGRIDSKINIKMKIEELKNLNLEILKKREMEKIQRGNQQEEEIGKIIIGKNYPKKMMNYLRLKDNPKTVEKPLYQSMLPQKTEYLLNLTKKIEEDTKNQKYKSWEIDDCLDCVQNVKDNLLNIQNILKDKFEFIKFKTVVDEKKIDDIGIKVDKIYEKLNSSAYKDLESFNGELKNILFMFFDKYSFSLFKLNEILESLNSYKIEYKSLIEFLIHNIRYFYFSLQIVEILQILIKDKIDNKNVLLDIDKYKEFSDSLGVEIWDFFNILIDSDNLIVNKMIYNSQNLEMLLGNIYMGALDSGNIIANINVEFGFSFFENKEESIYNEINTLCKKIEDELILFKNLLKNRLVVDEKLEFDYNGGETNGDFVVSDSDLDSRIAVLKNEINKKINEIKNDKQKVSDSAEFVLGLLKK